LLADGFAHYRDGMEHTGSTVMRATILTAAMLLVSLPATAQTGGDGSRGPRQPNATFQPVEIHYPDAARAGRPAVSATRQQARRSPTANRSRPGTAPRAN
jgi:hypothetical protein